MTDSPGVSTSQSQGWWYAVITIIHFFVFFFKPEQEVRLESGCGSKGWALEDLVK